MKTIYHKTQCITCKKAITEIQRFNEDVKTRDFFAEPFSEEELKKIIQMTGRTPFELLRRRDKMYKQLGLGNAVKSDAQIIKLMVKYPGLIARPIIVIDDKAFVRRVDTDNLS